MKKVSMLLILSLVLMPVMVDAFDYKTWIPLLPPTLGDMTPTGQPDGMNMDMSGQKWSSLNQEYKSSDGKKIAQFMVVAGQMAPQVQGFQSMAAMNMNMETGDQIIKTVTVSGKKSMLTLDKQSKSGTLMIPVKKDMILGLTLEPAASASELTSLAKTIPITKFETLK